MKRALPLLLALALLLGLVGCKPKTVQSSPAPVESQAGLILASPTPTPAEPTQTPTATPAPTPEPTPSPAPELDLPVEGEYYYDLENVVLYLELYHTLPDNYMTKNEARDLGWSGGTVERYRAGAAIGGDRFGNREGNLPAAKGRSYTECDLNTLGQNSRGAERLVFSSDGLYFYTKDHYEHFTEYVVTDDWEVVSK